MILKKSSTFSTSKVTVAADCSILLINICKLASICMLPKIAKEQRCLNTLGKKIGFKTQLLQILKHGLNSVCVISITVSLVNFLAYIELKTWVNLAERGLCMNPNINWINMVIHNRMWPSKLLGDGARFGLFFSFWVEFGNRIWIEEAGKERQK